MGTWKTVKLGDLFDFKNGLNKGVEYFGHGTPIVNYMDVNKRSFITKDSIKGLVEVTQSELKNCGARKGDVFFTRTSETLDEIGLSSALVDEIDNCVFSGYVLRARPKTSELLPKYCAYSLRLPSIRKEIMRKSSMTTRALTNGRFLSDVDFTYPDIKDQEHIVAILETWDEYLEKLDKKIELKKIAKKGLMQQLMSAKMRLTGFNGEWRNARLGEICSISTGKKDVNQGNPNGEYPFFTCSKEHTYSDHYSYDFEAILIAGNADVGHCKYYNGKFEAYQRTYILSNFTDSSGKYLFYFLSFFFKNQIESMKQIGAMSYIKLPMLQNFIVSLPDDKEQQSIAGVLDAATQEISLLEKRRDIARQQKTFLVNSLVAGKSYTSESATKLFKENQHA